MHSGDIFLEYRKLLEKVDAFSSYLNRKYSNRIFCRGGCSDCCQQNLTLLPVEIQFLRQGFYRLPGQTKESIKKIRSDSWCMLLHNGECLLYELRPVICRSHGLPLLITQDEKPWRDCCPKNFKGTALERLPHKDLLHLERLNTILISLNMVFASKKGLDPGKRLPVSSVAV